MSMRNVLEDLAAIRFPTPTRDDVDPPALADDALPELVEEVETRRLRFIEELRAEAEYVEDFDPLLAEVAAARAQAEDAERRLRLLLAYGREIVKPRHNLEAFAQAAGYSRSGVATAYGPAEVDEVRRRLRIAAPTATLGDR